MNAWHDFVAGSTVRRDRCALPAIRDVASRRCVIHAGPALLIEDSARAVHDPIASGYSPDHQLVIPYFGAFHWQVTGTGALVDLNTMLLVAGGQEFHETHPSSMIGHGSLVLTLSPSLAEELARRSGHGAGFPEGTRPLSAAIRLGAHRLLSPHMFDPLAREEIAIRLSAEAIGIERPARTSHGARLVERAKELLLQIGNAPISLDGIAREVGVSPVYLTQMFSILAGMPLYRYQRHLRLARALFELPSCDSLTELALDLGFSSHAHFTTAFRGAFGVTPSHFRADSAGRRRRTAPAGDGCDG